MIANYMRDLPANTLAVITLIALIITWLTALLVVALGDTPVSTAKGRYAWLLPIFTLLGIPAAIGLLQTTGVTVVFAAVVLIVFLLNISIPLLHLTGKASQPMIHDWVEWSIPLTVIGGLAVAGYLTFFESTGAKASCGPLGNCPTVQNSPYAILFGILRVGVLGLLGYTAILVCWLAWQFGPDIVKKWAAVAVWGLCIFGVLFSIYLTFLEPFVIGATCMWCISSAVLMLDLLLASTPTAQQFFALNDQ